MAEETLQPAVPKVHVTGLTFNTGQHLSLEAGDIVVIVGPNNGGKSAFLRDVFNKIVDRGQGALLLHGLELRLQGDPSMLEEWARRNGKVSAAPPFNASIPGVNATLEAIKFWWQNGTGGLQALANAFVANLGTDQRIHGADPVNLPPFTTQAPTHPLHQIYLRPSLEDKFSKLFRRAFGHDLVLNRLGGASTSLHIGQRPELKAGENLTSERYIREVEKLDLLHVQGDGIRSFAGVMLHALAGDRHIVLIDEPEAFLHPPQARLLGQMMVTETPSDHQLLLATHSGDLLRGIINSNSERVHVLRVRRDGAKNPIKQLDRAGIRHLWSDPLLRYSNALDGLFHEKVVICEADADCRFYGAVMDAVWNAAGGTTVPDAMFIHCGGKHRIPVLVTALHTLDVPLRVAIDFDALQDEAPLRQIIEGMGANWSDFEADWRAVKNSIDQKSPELKTDAVRNDIGKLLANIAADKFPRATADQIRRILRRSSPWAIAKEMGRGYVPAGTPRQTYDRLNERLRKVGIYLVEVGELESFCRSVGGHGPDWVNRVVQKDLLNDPELADARQFVHDLLS